MQTLACASPPSRSKFGFPAPESGTRSLLSTLLGVLLAILCTTMLPTTNVAAEPVAPQRKAVVLAASFDLFDVTGVTGEVFVRESTSRRIAANITGAIAADANLAARLQIVAAPTWSDEEGTTIRRHCQLALLSAAKGIELARSPDAAWAYLSRGLPYSIGTGLDFVSRRTGADVGIIFDGYRFRQSTSRAILMSALTIGSAARGPVALFSGPGSSSSAVVALVDLHSGRLLWANVSQNFLVDPSDSASAEGLVKSLFDNYPSKPVPEFRDTP